MISRAFLGFALALAACRGPGENTAAVSQPAPLAPSSTSAATTAPSTTTTASAATDSPSPAQPSPAQPSTIEPSAAPPSAAQLNATTPAPTTAAAASASAAPTPSEAPSTTCQPNRDCCKQDADCVAIDARQPCACPPCGNTLRWALNRKGYEAHQASWSRRRCRQPDNCASCTGSYYGRAVCEQGRCTVKP